MQAGESPKAPVYMKLISDMSPGKLVLMTVVTLAPVIAAILMQNPALRQSIQMRFWKKAELSYTNLSGFFERSAKQCQLKYDLARM